VPLIYTWSACDTPADNVSAIFLFFLYYKGQRRKEKKKKRTFVLYKKKGQSGTKLFERNLKRNEQKRKYLIILK
jgi:hypothetical protein